jgi:hypothetical protein
MDQQSGSSSQPETEHPLTEALPVARPPLLITVTGYRLANTILIAMFGIWKAITSYQGQSVVPTTLELVVGVFICIGWAIRPFLPPIYRR